ncbi:hypothetical protein [Roseateles sp. P5_E7]
MNDVTQCQGCGQTLRSPDAVCSRCEAELAEPPAPPGRHICPQCHANFAALAQVPWPPKVPWWRPTTMRLQCPHCDAPLRDRHAVQPPGWLVAVVIAWVFVVQLFTMGWTRMLLGLPVVIALYGPLIRAAWKSRQNAADPHRYVVGTTRFWAQGNEKLERAVNRLRQGSGDDPSR